MRIGGIIKCTSHPTRYVETTRNSNKADCVKSIRVLKDTGLLGFGCDVCRKAVRLDSVACFADLVFCPIQLLEVSARGLSCEGRCLGAIGAVLFDADAIMKQCCGEKALLICGLYG